MKYQLIITNSTVSYNQAIKQKDVAHKQTLFLKLAGG